MKTTWTPIVRFTALLLLAGIVAFHTPVKASEPTSARTYYVSPAGSDRSGDGSRVRPWASLLHATETVADGGCEIVFLDGLYGPQDIRRIFHRRATIRAQHPAGPRPGSPNRELQILLIVEACGGDVGRHVLDLAEGLADGGCEVHLISSPERGDRCFLGRLEAASRVRRTNCAIGRSSPLSGLMAVRMTRCYIRAHGPFDIIHGHDTKGGSLARIAAAGARACVFYTPHAFVTMARSWTGGDGARGLRRGRGPLPSGRRRPRGRGRPVRGHHRRNGAAVGGHGPLGNPPPAARQQLPSGSSAARESCRACSSPAGSRPGSSRCGLATATREVLGWRPPLDHAECLRRTYGTPGPGPNDPQPSDSIRLEESAPQARGAASRP